MSKCDLQIVLDRQGEAYKVGETVSGFVGVDVNTACTCNGLTVTCTWATHGSGNTVHGTEDIDVVFTGEWQAGEQHVHPFEFHIPRGPVTYHGHHLNVDWRIKATADIPWAFDPKVEERFAVHPDGAPDAYDLGPRFGAGSPEELAGNLGKIILTVFFVIFGLFGLGFLVAFFGIAGNMALSASGGGAEAVMGSLFMIPFLLVPLVFVGVAVWMIFKTWRNTIAERRLGPVEIEIAEDRYHAGETVAFTLRFQPTAAIDLNEIEATLKGEEVVIRGSGTKKRTYRQELHTSSVTLSESRKVAAGEAVSISGEIRLPDPAPHSFAAKDNTLKWAITVDIDIASWPDWSREWVLAVQPA